MRDVRYVPVGSDEYHEKIVPRLRAWKCPLPKLGIVAVYEDERGLSFFVLQLAALAEPMKLADAHRGTGVWLDLAAAVKALNPEVAYLAVDQEVTTRMAAALGLKPIDAILMKFEDGGQED
jgi:hypothetical protein